MFNSHMKALTRTSSVQSARRQRRSPSCHASFVALQSSLTLIRQFTKITTIAASLGGHIMLRDFGKFIRRGNVLDLAIAVVIGTAFGQIVTSLVNDIIMPTIGLILGRINFTNLFINLSDKHYTTLVQAKAAGAATINYGSFINTIINFLIIAFVIFLVIRQFNRFKKPAPQAALTTKKCTFCISDIPIDATRCPHCTSHVA